MDQNGNDQNVGAAAPDSLGSPNLGNPSADAGLNSTPDGQGGNQSNQWADKERQYKEQIRSLNKAVVESRRGGSRPQAGQGQGDGNDAFGTPEGQYAIAIELAENKLRGGLENVIPLYPEVPASEVARIRANPWAFVSRQTFLTGDWETGMLEVEQALLERADALSAANQPTGSPQGNASPVTVNSNPAPEPKAVDADAGSQEDENPWTMPMDKLEKAKNKAVAKLSAK